PADASDRVYDPPAEKIPRPAPPFHHRREPGLHQQLARKSLLLRGVQERRAVRKREAQPELLAARGAHASRIEVLPRRLGLGPFLEDLPVEVAREAQRLAGRKRLALARTERLRGGRDRDADALAELLDGFGEAQALHLHHEGEGVPAFLAAEAM